MPTIARTHRSDWLPILGVAVITALITYGLVASHAARVVGAYQFELHPFVNRFAGQPRSSQFYEEWLIRDFFKDRRGGVFLDVGAHHYRDLSNTYYLETALGWSGLAIEPQVAYAADYTIHRPRTRFVAMFASDVDDLRIALFVPAANAAMASATASFAGLAGAATAESVPTATLNRVLTEAGITRLDFVNMDIELHEPQALAGFDLARFQPALVCIEAHAPVRQAILDYFAARRYVVVGKYLRADVNNLYFAPAAGTTIESVTSPDAPR